MEEEAIYIGLDLHYFWSLNPKQYAKHLKAFNRQMIERVKETDTMNHQLGQYIYFAFNDPKNYPNKPRYTFPGDELKPMTDDEMERQARRNTIKMGGVINDR